MSIQTDSELSISKIAESKNKDVVKFRNINQT